MLKKQKQTAFTIVELLVVTVIIGILAAISIISYSGINNHAITALLVSDLDSDSKLLKMYYVEHDVYPDSLGTDNCPDLPVADNRYCLKASNGTELSYTGGDQSFILISTHDSSGLSYQITEDSVAAAVAVVGGGGSSASTHAIVWGGANWELSGSVIKTNDGSYMVGGTVDTNGTTTGDFLLAKFAQDGTLTWNKTWGGTNMDSGAAVIQTSDGGYASTGTTSSFGGGNSDIFLNKYTSDGTLSWNKNLGIGGLKGDTGYDLVQADDGGYVLTGGTANGSAGSIYDVFISKFDATGNILWTRTWGASGSNEYGRRIIKTSDGGYAVTGWAADNRGSGNWDMFLNKYTSNGTLSWSKLWGGVGSEQGNYVLQTSDDGYVVTGYTATVGFGAGSDDMFLTKFAADGSLLWSKTWGGTAADRGRSVIQTNDNNFIVAGTTASFTAGSNDLFIAKYTSGGSLLWSKTWGGTSFETGGMVLQNSDDSYVVSGSTMSYGSGTYDLLLLKFSPNGDMNNCSSPMCQSPTATENSPTVSVMTNNPAFTILTNPSNTVGTPSATLAPFSGVHSFVVSP